MGKDYHFVQGSNMRIFDNDLEKVMTPESPMWAVEQLLVIETGSRLGEEIQTRHEKRNNYISSRNTKSEVSEGPPSTDV